MAREIKILIVEDQTEWSEPLQKMYEDLTREIPALCTVEIASTSEEAVRFLQSKRFDLLSLDIDLSEDEQSRYDTWQGLLEKAKLSCTAAIITTYTSDPLLGEKAKKAFGSSVICRTKPGIHCTNDEINDEINRYRKVLSAEELSQICDQSDIGFWPILVTSITNTFYILIPVPNPWAEAPKFADVVKTLTEEIAIIYGQSNDKWYKDIMSTTHISFWKWTASICKVAGGLLLPALVFIKYGSIPALLATIPVAVGFVIGGSVGIVIYGFLLVEICIKSIGHFSRNYTALPPSSIQISKGSIIVPPVKRIK
jgi:hypothetical protein